MSRINSKFELTNLPEVKQQIGTFVAKKYLPKQLERAFYQAKDGLETYIQGLIEDTDTWAGLRGDYAGVQDKDLQAQFGLTADKLPTALAEIQEIIVRYMRFEFVRARAIAGGAAVEFVITLGDSETIKNDIAYMGSGSYDSDNGYEVPWAEWLIEGGRVYGHHISFEMKTPLDVVHSRTGRALMRRGGSWVTSQNGGFRSDIVREVEDLMDFNILSSHFSTALLRIL